MNKYLLIFIFVLVVVFFTDNIKAQRKRRGKWKDFTRVRWSVQVSTDSGNKIIRQKAFFNETKRVVLLVTRSRPRRTGISRSAILYDFNKNEVYIRSKRSCGPAKLGTTKSLDEIIALVKSREGNRIQISQTAPVQATTLTSEFGTDMMICKTRRNRVLAKYQFDTFTPAASQTAAWKFLGLETLYSVFVQ